MLSSWDCLIFVLYNLPFYSKCSKSQKQPNRLVEHNNALLNLLPNAAPLVWDPGTVQDLLEQILFVLDVVIWRDDNGHEGMHLFSRNTSAGCGAQTILSWHSKPRTTPQTSSHLHLPGSFAAHFAAAWCRRNGNSAKQITWKLCASLAGVDLRSHNRLKIQGGPATTCNQWYLNSKRGDTAYGKSVFHFTLSPCLSTSFCPCDYNWVDDNTILEKKKHQNQQHGECPRRISEMSKLASENMTDKVT